MLLPSTFAITLALLIFSMLCWGSFATTLKKSMWRFELYYLDFSLGALIAALIASFTVGSMGTDLSVQDSFYLVSKRPILFAFAAGCIFNLGNMLILAAVEVAGMSVAFPIGLGLALIVGAIWNFVVAPTGSALYLAGGCVLVLIAVVLVAVAQSQIETSRRKAAAALAPPPVEEPKPLPGVRKKQPVKEVGPSALLGVWLALAGGLVLGAFNPVAALSMEGELGFINPFAVLLVASIGIFVSTFIYNLYFMNLPVKGEPVSFFAYFTGTISQHVLGLLGGVIWMAGACASFAAAAAEGEAKAGPVLTTALKHGAIFVALFWGLAVWKEFTGATSATTRLIGIFAVLLLAGVGLVALS